MRIKLFRGSTKFYSLANFLKNNQEYFLGFLFNLTTHELSIKIIFGWILIIIKGNNFIIFLNLDDFLTESWTGYFVFWGRFSNFHSVFKNIPDRLIYCFLCILFRRNALGNFKSLIIKGLRSFRKKRRNKERNYWRFADFYSFVIFIKNGNMEFCSNFVEILLFHIF